MKSIPFTTARECYARQSDAGRHNPGRVAFFTHRRFHYIAEIPSGGRDDVYMFAEGSMVYCLSINTSLGYVGLTAFDCSISRKMDEFNPRKWKAHEAGDVFLQADHEIESALGKQGFDRSPINIAKILAEYIQV